MLEVKNLNFTYQKKPILKNISFGLEKGQSVCLLGKNGVGKSTLFKCLLRFLQPNTGTIIIDGKNIQQLSRQELAQLIAYIPQKQNSVFHFTAFEMVLMGTTSSLKSYRQPGGEERVRAEQALALLNILQLRDCLFSEISGGEQQLVIIARSVAQQSQIIIMDEPCANLDYGNQLMVLEIIKQLSQKGYLILQATHDPNHVLQYGDQVMILQSGELSAIGTPNDILTSQCLENIYHVPIDVQTVKGSCQKICLPRKGETDVEAV